MEEQFENNLLSEKDSIKRYQIINYAVQSLKIENTWNKFVEAGIDPILIKGWSIAQYYPNQFERSFTDVDLIADPHKKNEIEKKILQIPVELNIDWHFGARHLDSLSFEELYQNSNSAKCGNTQIRVLCPEDHLRVLAVHWLTDGGEYKEKLWDIFYLVENTRKTFDWSKSLDVVEDRRRRWILVVLALTQKYLKLDLSETPIAKFASDKAIPSWISETLEREWASDLRIIPLDQIRHDRKMFWKQIKKRFPPNPIQAVIMEGGDFDKHPQFYYQFKNILSRFNEAYSKRNPKKKS